MKRLQGKVSKKKLLILLLSVILLTATILLRAYEHRERKKELRQENTEEISVPESGTEDSTGEAVPESGTETEWKEADTVAGLQGIPESAKKTGIRIKNLDEYAAVLLGENKTLLEKRLEEWCSQNQPDTTVAEMIHVMYPLENPDALQFFVRLNDTPDCLVVLTYNQKEHTVTADACNHTEAEVMGETWEGNAPAKQDVSAEKENDFLLKQEETDGTE